MKVLFLSPVGEIGGAERVLLSMLDSLQQGPGVAVQVLLGAPGPLLAAIQQRGVKVKVVPLPPSLAGAGDSSWTGGFTSGWQLAWQALPALGQLRRYVSLLRAEIEAIGPTIVHSNGIKTHLLAAWARPTMPVLWHIHDFLSARTLAGPALRWWRRRAAGSVAVSEAVARDAARVLPGLPVTVVVNGIDLEVFAPGAGVAHQLEALAGLPPAPAGTVHVGLVATYSRWKGHAVFLEAAARIRRETPDLEVRFYIIGGPIYQTVGSQVSEKELRSQAARLGIAERVGFVGFQMHMAPLYRSLDVVVQASTRPEPFGLTIVEAMACGRPVVVAEAGGAAEIVADGSSAVRFPPGDSAALAAAITRLVRDAALRRQLGETARHVAAARFDQRRLGPELRAVYARLAPTGH